MIFWLCDFFIFVFSCLQNLVVLLVWCLLALVLFLIFASSLKYYYCPLLFDIKFCHNVRLHVIPCFTDNITPCFTDNILKKNRRNYTVNSLYQEASGLNNLWVIWCPLARILYVYSDSFTVTKMYFVSIRHNERMMMMIMTAGPVNLNITH